MSTPTRLVFVGLLTDTIDDACQGVVVDLDRIDFAPDDDYFDEARLTAVALSDGVPVADLFESYQRERRVIESLGCVFDVDDDGHVRAQAVAR